MSQNTIERQIVETELKLKFISKIGEGSFGKVYKAIDYTDQTHVAVKQKIESDKKNLSRRITIYVNSRTQKHSAIQKSRNKQKIQIQLLFKIFSSPKYTYMIMELMDGGTLRQFLTKRKKENLPLSEEEVSQLMCGIFQGLNHMHEKSIIHRDLKTDNILLKNSQDLTSVKIADFGLSFQFTQENNAYKLISGKCGTFYFMAPEQLNNQKYSKPIDIWACGIIMHLLLTGGMHPFIVKNESKDQYIKSLRQKTYYGPIGVSSMALDLLGRLLMRDPFERYSAGQALIHPWISRRLTDTIPLSIEETRNMFKGSQQLIQVNIHIQTYQKFKIILFIKFLQKISKQNGSLQVTKKDILLDIKIENNQSFFRSLQDSVIENTQYYLGGNRQYSEKYQQIDSLQQKQNLKKVPKINLLATFCSPQRLQQNNKQFEKQYLALTSSGPKKTLSNLQTFRTIKPLTLHYTIKIYVANFFNYIQNDDSLQRWNSTSKSPKKLQAGVNLPLLQKSYFQKSLYQK